MNIDQEIVMAIGQAVDQAGQGEDLARHLTAWFSSVASGNESLVERDAVQRRLDLLLETVQVDVDALSE